MKFILSATTLLTLLTSTSLSAPTLDERDSQPCTIHVFDGTDCGGTEKKSQSFGFETVCVQNIDGSKSFRIDGDGCNGGVVETSYEGDCSAPQGHQINSANGACTNVDLSTLTGGSWNGALVYQQN